MDGKLGDLAKVKVAYSWKSLSEHTLYSIFFSILPPNLLQPMKAKDLNLNFHP